MLAPGSDAAAAMTAGFSPQAAVVAGEEYALVLERASSVFASQSGDGSSCQGAGAGWLTSIFTIPAEWISGGPWIFSVSVDRPPDAIIDSAAHGTTSDSTPSFAFHSTEAGSTFECSIDTGTPSFGTCSGPGETHTPASTLADGAYTFRVRAIDSDGTADTDPSPATEAFTVETPVPTPPGCAELTTPPVVQPTTTAPTGQRAAALKKCKKKSKKTRAKCKKRANLLPV